MISRPDTAASRSVPPSTAAAEAGFTLIEMLVVIAILGFALILVAGFRAPWSRGLDIETAAAQLATTLRLVRSDAIAADRPVDFTLDLSHHRYRAGPATAARPLPAALSLQLLTIAGERRATGEAGIRFNPDGSSTGGRIVLGNGVRRVAVGVDWLTGRVSVADIR